MTIIYNRFIWISFVLMVILSSCVSTGKISIQVSGPPKRAIPNDIQSVVMMNKSMSPAFSDYNTDSLENLFVRKKLKLEKEFLDSLASDTTLQRMGNALYESGRFDVVIPLRRNLPTMNTQGKGLPASLTLPQVRQICNEFKTDALFVLENFSEKVKTSYQAESGFSADGIPMKEYRAYIQVAYHSNWKLYQPLEKLLMARFEVKDTIFWEKTGSSLQKTYEKLPTIKEALIGGAIENAENLASYISPVWRTEERMYFVTKNKDADKAIDFLKKNEWKEAQNKWMEFSTSKSVSLRSQIEFNLALASEMNGNLKEAVEWAGKSFKTKYSKAAEDYLRLLNLQLLNK